MLAGKLAVFAPLRTGNGGAPGRSGGFWTGGLPGYSMNRATIVLIVCWPAVVTWPNTVNVPFRLVLLARLMKNSSVPLFGLLLRRASAIVPVVFEMPGSPLTAGKVEMGGNLPAVPVPVGLNLN